jgi:hypothetical protein
MFCKSNSEISIPIDVRAASITSADFSSSPRISLIHSKIKIILCKFELTSNFFLHRFVHIRSIHYCGCAAGVVVEVGHNFDQFRKMIGVPFGCIFMSILFNSLLNYHSLIRIPNKLMSLSNWSKSAIAWMTILSTRWTSNFT